MTEWMGREALVFFLGAFWSCSADFNVFLLWCLQPGAKTSLIDFPKALRALAALGFVPPLDPLSNRGAERPRQRLWRELILLGKAGSTGWWQVRLTRILPFLSHELLSTILAWLVLWTIFHGVTQPPVVESHFGTWFSPKSGWVWVQQDGNQKILLMCMIHMIWYDIVCREAQREREREEEGRSCRSCIYRIIYIYIQTYVYTIIYIHMYLYIYKCLFFNSCSIQHGPFR